ncbi:hypothetical protein DMN91_007906 [Ooceraea biroi]|uniref:Structural maintenance of chromosomes protein n=1 Tax=Ooceraea biroi TaxID=2015173 RepID=A0A3L8DHF3_OOCBI|nr:hypothetical protein DMN91_007906 [Ooceraea biroi]
MISLKTITLDNFKSFRGGVIIGPIQPFTVVMGPNGSGKSNIIDAVRFVLGEKSSELRVQHPSELAHGAMLKSPVTEVVVVMILKIDDKERSFKRMIHGESSQYEIDDKIVTHDFYMTELRNLNLDIKTGNFLVPQGYIECIAMKTPKELTEMLEQFSGSEVLKADYTRLKLEVQKVEGEAQFVRQMRKQLLLQKQSAKEERAEAEKYTELLKQYVEEKTKFQLYRLLLIKKTLETLRIREREVKLQIDEHLFEKSNGTKSLKEKKLELKELSASLEDVESSIAKLEKVIQEKRTAYVTFEETTSYWQKKCDFAHASLDNANKAQDANKKAIEELENELEKTNVECMKLRETRESEEDIELSNSQVERYMNLKTEAENRMKGIVTEINNLTRNQQANRDKLDDCNRRKQELEDKAERITLMKKDHEERFKKLRDVHTESVATVTRMTAKKAELSAKLATIQLRVSSLESDVAKVSEELRESDIDSYTVSHQTRKAMIMKRLKESFSGVYDRLCNLCKPVHPRYNIAVTKVLKRYFHGIVVDSTDTAKRCIEFLKSECLDVELFLPLDSLKTVTLKEKLRSVQELPNVKLLYDVIDILSPEISKAVLFVTENTLVCETAEDTRKLAFEIWHRRYNCVSLDGCLFGKSGLISGGEADLAVKAKQWGDQQVASLKNRKAQLVQELRSLPVPSHVQSELNESDIQIKGVALKNHYMEADMKDAEKEIASARKELSACNTELSRLNTIISEIERKVEENDEEIGDMKRHISAVEDDIFANFCKDINVPNISYYEKTNLRTYKEQKKKQLELEEQSDRIENQLSFERERDMTSTIIKWKTAALQANVKLNDTRAKENGIKIVIEQKETKLSELNNKRAGINNNLETMKNDLALCKSQLDNVEELYVNSRRMHILVQNTTKQKKVECKTVFKECKIEDINIPMLPSEGQPRDFLSSTFSSGSNLIGNVLNTESSIDREMLTEVDFSQCPDEIRNKTEEDLQDTVKRLDEKVEKIKNELDTMKKPNFKAQEKVLSIAEQIHEANAQFQELRQQANYLKVQFEKVKMTRYKLFSDCLECISTEIDSIYKGLVNDESAQALILPENPEEPYAGTINFSCIPPNKRFQPMQHLSGGERTLASLALLFAMQRFKPTPFFIMDESDAALDKRNIKNIVRYIKSQAKTMQFIIITFQEMLQINADAIIGITTEPDVVILNSNMFAFLLNNPKARK